MIKTNRKKFTADLETTTDPNDCHVWAWAVCEIGNTNNFIYDNNITTFFEFCQQKENFDIYYHNLKFDGQFLLNYLLRNGFKFIENKRDKADKTFTTLISDMGQFYCFEIFFEVGNKKVNSVKIIDSIKILNMPVLEVAKAFGLGEHAEKIKQEKIDYEKERKEGYQITKEELIYLKNDVEVMAIALNTIFSEGLTKMTAGSNALNNYKEIISKEEFEYYFPVLDYEIDEQIRKSYKGGFCYVNPANQDKIVNDLMVLDVNSLYPSTMYHELLPVGQPLYFEGKYKEDKFYPLYVQHFRCSFELKEGKIPSLLSKNSYKNRNEYITSSNGEIEDLVMTNVDMDLFFKNYDVDVNDLTYINGFKFRGKLHLFDKYIEYWTERKINSKKEGNKGLYKYSKVMLNSLYGKFGLNPDGALKEPYLDNDGIVKYKSLAFEKSKEALKDIKTLKVNNIIHEVEEGQTLKEIEKIYKVSWRQIFIDNKDVLGDRYTPRQTIYIPMASFITSYARRKTIETSQKIKDFSIKNYGEDYYCYSDTDSIHCKKIPMEELSKIIEVDPYKLGAWDLEAEPEFGKFIRQKSYMEYIDNEYKVTCSGLSKSCIRYNKDHSKIYYKIFDENECIYNINNTGCNECEHLGCKECFYKEFDINDFKVGFMCGGKLSFKYVPRWSYFSRNTISVKGEVLKCIIMNI